MNLLLDTHVVIWALGDPGRLGPALEVIAAADRRLVSTAVVWEVAIKSSLGRLDLGGDVDRWVSRTLADLVADILPIGAAHAAETARLPWHHRDPFDRMIVAQARAEGASVVTADDAFGAYDVEVVGVGR